MGRVLLGIIDDVVDHVQQALQVPAVQSNGALALVAVDAAVQAEAFGHQKDVFLQLVKLSARDQDLKLAIAGSWLHHVTTSNGSLADNCQQA